MTERSVFRDFITGLRNRWRLELPAVRPIEENFGPMMAKASTFYAGFAARLGMHVFVNFQHFEVMGSGTLHRQSDALETRGRA